MQSKEEWQHNQPLLVSSSSRSDILPVKTSEPAMPTTEQIKHLIHIARQHLASREQSNSLSQNTYPQENSFYQEPTIDTIFGLIAKSTVLIPKTVSPKELLIRKYKCNRDQNDEDDDDDGDHVLLDNPISVTEESLESHARADGIDITTLSSKERRQLRNRISARNFRVRRKEYITTLEALVKRHKKHASSLTTKLTLVQDENEALKAEKDSLLHQNSILAGEQSSESQISKDHVAYGDASDGFPQEMGVLV